MRLRAGARNGLFPATHQATICPFKRVRVHDRLREPRREFLQQNIAEAIIRPKYLISVSSAISLASGDVSNRGFQPTPSKCFTRWPDCGQALRQILCSATSPPDSTARLRIVPGATAPFERRRSAGLFRDDSLRLS